MIIEAVNADTVYQLFTIEADRSGKYRVVDKRGANAVESEWLTSFAEAQREWSRRVEEALSS